MNVTKEQFINALKSNWNYPDSLFEELYEIAETVDLGLEFMEYYDGIDQNQGTLQEYYDDFMEIY